MAADRKQREGGKEGRGKRRGGKRGEREGKREGRGGDCLNIKVFNMLISLPKRDIFSTTRSKMILSLP